jgi:hypothetical protein
VAASELILEAEWPYSWYRVTWGDLILLIARSHGVYRGQKEILQLKALRCFASYLVDWPRVARSGPGATQKNTETWR